MIHFGLLLGGLTRIGEKSAIYQMRLIYSSNSIGSEGRFYDDPSCYPSKNVVKLQFLFTHISSIFSVKKWSSIHPKKSGTRYYSSFVLVGKALKNSNLFQRSRVNCRPLKAYQHI